MQSIREDIEKEHHAVQNSDVIVFFKVAWFITSFQYHKITTSEVREMFYETNFLHLIILVLHYVFSC